MRGKIGLVIGLGAGYVLGSRAGRARYEQIKDQALKVWNLDPVQRQVSKVKSFATSGVMALPGALWDGAVKVTKAAAKQGTAGQKLDSVIEAGKSTADEIKEAAAETLDEVSKAADDAPSRAGTTTGGAKSTASGARRTTGGSTAKKTAPRGKA